MARSTVVSLSGWDGLAERAQVGPNTRGQREGDDVSFGSMLSKSRKSKDTENLAKVVFSALLQRQGTLQPIRRPVVVFVSIDVGPQVAAREAHQRLWKISFGTPKRLFRQHRSKADLMAPSDFRFTPESGLRADIAPCPVRANTGRAAQQRASTINHFSPQNIGSNSVILYVRPLLMGHQGV
jgi:hypothetical protein